jgi:hypothetical protein
MEEYTAEDNRNLFKKKKNNGPIKSETEDGGNRFIRNF